MEIHDIDYDDLDPGIRELVKALRLNGFDTCDSGDGESKFDEDGEGDCGCAEPMANVYITSSRENLLTDCDRLVEVLKRLVKPGLLEETLFDNDLEQEVPKVIIEATYLPMDGTAILAVHGLADVDLRKTETV